MGQTVTSTPADAHRFWNAGEDDLRCSDYMQPVDNIEYFLSEVFASQARYGTWPDHFHAVQLARHSRSGFVIGDVPAAVQRFVFPVLVSIGRLLGRYARFADALELVTR